MDFGVSRLAAGDGGLQGWVWEAVKAAGSDGAGRRSS